MNHRAPWLSLITLFFTQTTNDNSAATMYIESLINTYYTVTSRIIQPHVEYICKNGVNTVHSVHTR